MILETLPQVQALSREQKCRLMDELWIETFTDAQSEERSSAIQSLLKERQAELLATPRAVMTVEEHLAKLKAGQRS